MSKVLLAVNTLTMVDSMAYASHLNLVYRIGRDTTDEFLLYNSRRVSIDRFRNQAAAFALRYECDYLMFLDDDVLVPANIYQTLKSHDKDVVTPLVYIRSYPYKPMMFKGIIDGEGAYGLTTYDDWELKITAENSLLEVAAVGFSCCLIKCSVLRKIPPAWFVTGTNHTEDVYFCIKARKALENQISIFVDTKTYAGHLLDPEFVSYETKKELLMFSESLNPELTLDTMGDRVDSYLNKNKVAAVGAPVEN
jgi:hypothetical protein